MRSSEPPLHRLRQLARGDRRPDEPVGLASTEGQRTVRPDTSAQFCAMSTLTCSPIADASAKLWTTFGSSAWGPRICTIGPMIAGPLSCTMTGALRWHARPLCPGRPRLIVPRPDRSKGRHLREGSPAPHARRVSRRQPASADATRRVIASPRQALHGIRGASLCTPVAPQERTTDGTDRGPRPAAWRAPRPTARPPARGSDCPESRFRRHPLVELRIGRCQRAPAS
jgi:hypothetical protein